MKRVRWVRECPVRYRADVAIVGGGVAGVAAACSAAGSGAKVVLVEQFGVTGGNMTVGGVTGFCGETAGQGRSRAPAPHVAQVLRRRGESG